MMNRRNFLLGAAMPAVVLPLVGALMAFHIPHQFVTVASGDWNDPAIWKDGRLPGVGDTAVVKHHIVSSLVVLKGPLVLEHGAMLYCCTIYAEGQVISRTRET